MSDREKLIEICDTNNGWVDEVPVERFVDYLISNGVTVQKWIPVSERLPTEEDADEKGRVYAISEGAYPRMWQWKMVDRYPECFTHWYKLPEPPKECE